MVQLLIIGLTLIVSTLATSNNEPDWSNRRFVVMSDNSTSYQIVDLKMQPETFAVNNNDISLHLYTMNNEHEAEIITNLDINQLLNSKYFDPSKYSVFFVHGLNGAHNNPAALTIREALIEAFDINAFIVDWSGPAGKFYTTAKSSVPKVAKLVAEFIKEMYKHYDITSDKVRLIGHSLGAHLCGCIGKNLNGDVNYILGLDPAGPGYSSSNTKECLSKDDAKVVHVIHTNGGMLGIKDSIGDADFFPNGGSKQAGCGLDLLGSCAHRRSFEYLAESLKESNFYAYKCDSYDNYKKGKCAENERSLMGGFHINFGARGNFYLDTATKPPFALGH